MADIIDINTGKASGGPQSAPEHLKEILDNANQRKAFNAGRYPNYQCSCGCKLFTTAVVIKKVPAIDLGEIAKGDVPLPIEQIPVWVCTKCGELAPFIKDDPESMKIINKLLQEEGKNNNPEPAA